MSHEDGGWWEPNQQHGLTRQMEDGIRGLLLDSYEFEGELWLCHGLCELGKQRLADGLAEIEAFLRAHPHEVIILFFQDAVGSEAMSEAILESGLSSLAYTHVTGQAFPTLGEMIASNARLIIASESAGPPPAWYHSGWDLFFDTPYSFQTIDDFSCSLNRGSIDNPLFLMNHWVSSDVGLPSPEGAAQVNRYDILMARATTCFEEYGRVPTLIAVDFYATGDLFDVVNALNKAQVP